MEKTIADASPRRGVIRRAGAAVIAMAMALVLAGCHEAAGLGTIGQPVDTGAVGVPDLPAVPLIVPNGKAGFAFTYSCDPKDVDGRVYTYFDTSTNSLPTYRGLKLSGKVERTFIDPDGAEGPIEELVPARSCQEVIEAQVAQFEGSYKSTDKKYSNAKGGRFTILVFDQDNPSLPAGEFTGDGFSIELFGGPYNLYTRAGYIEKGEIYAN